MKKTTGGWRAAMFETITAADRGAFMNKSLFVIDGLLGVWRQCKPPRGNPAEVGCLPCWFDGGVIYLTPEPDTNTEIEHTRPTIDNLGEVADLIIGLMAKRDEAVLKQVTEPKTDATGPTTGAQNAEVNTTDPAPGVPAAGEVDV